eukprot:352890-Chlamydomonas_euryale.AAC.2
MALPLDAVKRCRSLRESAPDAKRSVVIRSGLSELWSDPPQDRCMHWRRCIHACTLGPTAREVALVCLGWLGGWGAACSEAPRASFNLAAK